MMNKRLFRELFKEKRLRMSHPRFLVFQELATAQASLSPQDLFQILIRKKRRIGLTSIYRSLDLFESMGIVFKIVNGPSVKYKLCKTEEHHHHIVCKKCGNVAEVSHCNISDWTKKVIESTGYEVTDHQFNFYGFCKACKNLN